jgi:gliding motility-associated-like protein
MDASFGHYINYTGIPTTDPDADPCDPEGIGNPGGQGHIPILNKLAENETFQQYYISRFIDLANTSLSCEYMNHVLDSLIDIIEPEMQGQIDRWGGTYAEWQSEVQQLKDFMNARCDSLAAGLIDCYDVTGPFEVMIKSEPEGAGKVKVNSIWLDHNPFLGTYYGDIDILLKAEPEYGFVFDHWELLNHTVSPGNNAEDVILNLSSSDTIVAVFVNPIPKVDLGADTAICIGSQITLDAGNAGASFLWHDGTISQTYTLDEAGSYGVTVTNMGYTGSDQITIELIHPPTVNLQPEYEICTDQILNISYNQEHADSILWSDFTTNETLSITEPGIYWVQAFNICGQAVDSTNVFQGFTPNVDLGPNQTIEPGQTLILDATTYQGTYLWQDESTANSFLVDKPGTYWVVVTNSCGTTYDDILIDYEITLHIPNAFSPNGDGINDEFKIKGFGVAEEGFEMIIFDRLGRILFETTSLHEGWDGKVKDYVPGVNVYQYIIHYQDVLGNKYHTTGTITSYK